jgi:hypothetical protein
METRSFGIHTEAERGPHALMWVHHIHICTAVA